MNMSEVILEKIKMLREPREQVLITGSNVASFEVYHHVVGYVQALKEVEDVIKNLLDTYGEL